MILMAYEKHGNLKSEWSLIVKTELLNFITSMLETKVLVSENRFAQSLLVMLSQEECSYVLAAFLFISSINPLHLLQKKWLLLFQTVAVSVGDDPQWVPGDDEFSTCVLKLSSFC